MLVVKTVSFILQIDTETADRDTVWIVSFLRDHFEILGALRVSSRGKGLLVRLNQMNQAQLGRVSI